jgi:hypothetical protein
VTARKPTRAKQLGVSDDEYARLLAGQDGHCALCSCRPKSRRLHVDHDHMSKPPRVRGLLCHRCNRGLPTWVTRQWLEAAADYIDPSPQPVKHSERVQWLLAQRFPSGVTRGAL